MEQSWNSSWDPSEAIPPWRWILAARVGGIGAGLALIGGLLGGSATLDALSTLMILVGILLAGIATWQRPSDPLMWLILSLTCGLSWLGSPASWDSVALLTLVGSWGAMLGAGLAAMPLRPRLVGITALVFIHFLGILTAVTGPPPQPWVTGQAWTRVYRPYLQFTYLNNAYQFYSPDPGPANQMWACVKLDTGDPENPRYEWYRFPERPRNVKDPLAMTYYRRLSLTEHLNAQDATMSVFEDGMAKERRGSYVTPSHGVIPMGTPLLPAPSFRAPDWELRRRLLPAYAHQIATEMEEEYGLPVESLQLYRVEHRIMDPVELAKPESERRGPYHKSWYLPYFLGEYNAKGELLDSKDSMLYWLVPIVPKQSQGYGAPPATGYDDWLSIHADKEVDWGRQTK